MNPERIESTFPAPSYRGNQGDALRRIRAAFEAGNRVVLVRAPTGSGKSLLARAVMGCARRVEDAEPHEATGAFYTTPQVSQLDAVAVDDLLDDLKVIRGKRNYTCLLPGEETTSVDRAPCARERGYDCSVKHRCPYFSDRAIAANREFAAMTLAYFMHTAGSEVFGRRDVVVVDEAHGLAEWAEMYATIRLAPETVPVWEDVRVPEVDGVEDAARFAEHLLVVCEGVKDELLGKDELAAAEAATRDRLQELRSELKWFVEDSHDPESPTTWVVDQPDSGGTAITIKPMNPERYLRHTVWDRGNRFALLSATILNKEAFCRQVGLDPARVALVDVGHTFPVDHRPLYDATCGKMTYEHRADTLPALADAIVSLMGRHPAEKGIVHCHSYAIQADLDRRLREASVEARVRTHEKGNRDAQLSAWLSSGKPEVFLSVKMEEALDLEGDLARWQVLCKAPFPNTRDSRVAARLEDDQWAWYYRAALRTVVQACGRVVRAPDDHGATYLADSSLLDLFDRARSDLPAWFAEQVEEMTSPALPDPDPDAALAGMDGRVGGRDDEADGGDGPTKREPGSASNRDDAPTRNRAPNPTPDYGDPDGGRGGSTARSRSPMADVWDTK